MTNSIILSGTGGSVPSPYDEFLTNTIPTTAIINNSIKVRLVSQSSTHRIYHNWLSIAILTTSGTIQSVRGGGELHITNFQGNITANITGSVNGILTYLNTTIYPMLTNIQTYLNTTIYPYLTQMLNKLLGIETQLNTTINITNTTLNLAQNINGTTTLIKNDTGTIIGQIGAVNASMVAGFAEKDAHIQSAYNNMTSQVTNLSNNISQSFNSTWAMIQALNSTQSNNQILSYLTNITLAINSTQAQIANINQSLNQQILNTSNNTQTLINAVNSTTQARFDQMQSYLDNLTLLINTNQNITQGNISALMAMLTAVNSSLTTDISNLNTSLYSVRADLLSQINQTYNTLLTINQSISNQLTDISNVTNETEQHTDDIMEFLNISTADLNLAVSAPSKCLVQTNWLAEAQVKDRYGNILSYLDGVNCNMTTDLWGTSNMSYYFLDNAFRYIHNCENTTQTFNWSVNCARVS